MATQPQYVGGEENITEEGDGVRYEMLHVQPFG
jgi:hypothetical protein